jgi:hypothetical protein
MKCGCNESMSTSKVLSVYVVRPDRVGDDASSQRLKLIGPNGEITMTRLKIPSNRMIEIN